MVFDGGRAALLHGDSKQISPNAKKGRTRAARAHPLSKQGVFGAGAAGAAMPMGLGRETHPYPAEAYHVLGSTAAALGLTPSRGRVEPQPRLPEKRFARGIWTIGDAEVRPAPVEFGKSAVTSPGMNQRAWRRGCRDELGPEAFPSAVARCRLGCPWLARVASLSLVCGWGDFLQVGDTERRSTLSVREKAAMEQVVGQCGRKVEMQGMTRQLIRGF